MYGIRWKNPNNTHHAVTTSLGSTQIDEPECDGGYHVFLGDSLECMCGKSHREAPL